MHHVVQPEHNTRRPDHLLKHYDPFRDAAEAKKISRERIIGIGIVILGACGGLTALGYISSNPEVARLLIGQ